MQRLLHEGMDAGLCGFSIQRLGRNSAQADFDGSPMVTDTMVDEDILALAEVLPSATRASSRSPRRPATSRPTWRSWRSWPTVAQRPDPPQRDRRQPTTNPDPPPQEPALAGALRAQGLPIFGQAATVRTGFAFTLEHWNLYDVSPAWRDVTTGTKEEKRRRCATRSCARRCDEAEEADVRSSQAIQAGVGGTPAAAYRAAVANGQPDLEQYVGRSLGEIAEEEGKHPVEVMLDLSLAERPERRVPPARTGASTPSSRPR